LEECGLSVEDELSYPREFEHMTLARVLIARGEHDEAWALLERLLREAEAGARGGRVVEILMLQALVLQARNDRPNAIAALRRALTLAEPEGYVRVFADEGEPMVSLLKGLVKRRTARPPDAERDVSLEYVSKLMEALGVRAPGAGTRAAASPLADPISERELEVLGLLDSDLSHREIAAKLFVSLDTVKSHTKHLYRKLGVRARHQAVARAKELGLI